MSLLGFPAIVSAEEGDDEDDPEYNFLDDPDEPDQEDYRTDRGVRITSESICGKCLWRSNSCNSHIFRDVHFLLFLTSFINNILPCYVLDLITYMKNIIPCQLHTIHGLLHRKYLKT